MQANNERNVYESKQTQSHFDITTGLQSHHAPLNRLSEQEDEDDDGDYDDDDNVEEGYDDDLLDNVSKNTTSSTYTCYSGRGDSKINAYSCATDASSIHSDLLRKRNVASVASAKIKSKCVQFMPSPKRNVHSSHSTRTNSPAELNVHSKPLKKIIFNGTFEIDEPYSSRF